MNESLLNRILKDHKRRTRSLALILCLSMIVSLGTFAGFHKNAIAKVYTREVLDCPFAREGAEPVAHTHNDDCYEGGKLVCTLPEREAHIHSDGCYTELQVLLCTLEENPGHQHSEECYDENGELICQIPEGEGAHTHTDECYSTERVMICDKQELPVHVHDAGCIRMEEITVDEPEETAAPEESTIPEMPVSDPDADLETADDWNREFENLELSGNWARDLVLVAATQQGRGESPNNFETILNDAGDAWVTHGYTRYGAWYGYPYAEWDAMFVSFCLRYAGIPAENVPNNPTAAFMAESFSMGGLFAGRDYIPAVGDLIFFDTVDDEITNIDHMGIVYHVDAEGGTINTVEGDRTDAVATFGYYLNDEQIVGYGILPQNPNYIPVEGENTDNTDEAFDGFIFMTTDEEEEKQEETTTAEEAPVPEVPMPAQNWERTAGGIKVSVEAPEGAFPENTTIAVTPVNGSSLKDTVSDAVSGEVLEVQAVDITFFDAEGREIEPAVPIRVTMTPAATEHAEEKANVVHVDIAQQTAELIEQAEGTETDNSEVVFEAEAFTIYAIVYTVDFEYEVNGQVYTASIPGARDLKLSEVLGEMGIVDEESREDFFTKIAAVASTDEEVLTVLQEDDDWTIRVLKDGDAALAVTMQDTAVFRISVSADGITEVSDENEVAVIRTVGELYLPEEAEAKAEVVENADAAIEAVQNTAASAEAERENIEPSTANVIAETMYQVFDIQLNHVDPEAYEGFQVFVTLPENIIGSDFHLYHIHEGETTDITASLEMTAVATTENGELEISDFCFYTDDFSEFVLQYTQYTVDFHWEVDGRMYEFSLPGGGFISFSELMEVLGVAKTGENDDVYLPGEVPGIDNQDENGENQGENGAESAEISLENAENEGNSDVELPGEVSSINNQDATGEGSSTVLTLDGVVVSEKTREFVRDVESVEFSSPELVDVSKVESETTVGGIKESRGLDVQYSAELTEEQIAEINSTVVESEDWALISMQPFESEEVLTVTMNTGEVFEIRVTDYQLKKTVISDSGETWEITVTYGPEAQIPNGAELKVEEILPEDERYEQYYQQSLEKIGVVAVPDTTEEESVPEVIDESYTETDPAEAASEEDSATTGYAHIFDIQIWAGDQQIEPASGSAVSVSIKLLDAPENEDTNLQVVHFGKDGLEVMELAENNDETKAGGTELNFVTDEFSVYSVVDVTTSNMADVLGNGSYALVTGIAADPGATVGYDETWGRDYFTIIVNANAVMGYDGVVAIPETDDNTRWVEKTKGLGAEGVHAWTDSNGNNYVGGGATQWQFESAGNGRYRIFTNDNGSKQYITHNNAEVSLTTNQSFATAFSVTPSGDGTTVLIHDGNMYLRNNAGNANGDSGWAAWVDRNYILTNNASAPSGNEYKFRLCKESDDFDSFAAEKVSAATITTNANYIIYRKFEDEKGKEMLYALAHDGTFVRVYDGGDTIYWRETDKNIYWNYQMDGRYPVLFTQDPDSGETIYINPSHSDGQTLSTTANGLTLLGKDNGEYSTAIECWDQAAYDYAGLHVTVDGDGNATLSTGTRVAGTSDEFLFAIASHMPGATAETVDTVDSDSLGIKITMFDYGNANGWNDETDKPYAAGDKITAMTNIAGSDEYTPHAAHALVKAYLESGLPTGSNGAMTGLFTAGGSAVTYSQTDVNHLFLQSYYDENGTFRYRSEDNYAYLGLDGNKDFTVYRQAATPYTTDMEPGHTYYYHGHFMPYNQIDMNNNLSRLMNQYGNEYTNGTAVGEIPVEDGRTYEDIYGVQGIPNFYTGMMMEAKFTQPRDGKLDNGDDMIFKFTGDDDMWVYIDGILVLDIGGIHEPLSGTINFATGVVTNPTGSSLAGTTTLKQIFMNVRNADDTPQEVKDKIDAIVWDGDTFADYTNHDFKAFYMERGAGASNLDIQFNLKVTLTNEFTVEKEIPEGVDERFANQIYKFQATYMDGTTEKGLHAGIENVCTAVVYKGTNDPVEVDDDGYFYLKAGESAVFKMADESIRYNVKEVEIDSDLIDQVDINGQQTTVTDGTAEAGYAMVEDRTQVTVTNHPKTQNLKITKHLTDDSAPLVEGENPVFEFRVYLETTITNEDGITQRQLVPYSYAPYYLVKEVDGETHYFTLTGVNNAPVDKGTEPVVCSTTGRSGSINSIPPEYTIIIPNLVVGTNFYVEERRDNIPEGYEFVREELTAGTYDPNNLGTTEDIIDHVLPRDQSDTQEFDPSTIGRIKQGVDAESHVYNRKPAVIITIEKEWDPAPAAGTTVTVELRRYAKITKGTISVTLYDNNEAPIEGAVFELYKDGEATGTEVTTNVNGIASISGLEAGIYKLVQKSTPEGYSMDGHTTETGTLTVVDNVTTPQTLSQSLTNTALVTAGKVTLTLTDSGAGSGTAGTPIVGATYTLYKDGSVYSTGHQTNSEGKVVIGNLGAGEYYLVQTATTADYNLPNVTRTANFTVVENPGVTQEFNQSMTNSLKGKGTVSLTLTKDSGEAISGASFQLKSGNTVLETKQTGSDGTLSFDTVLYEGTYTVHQVDTGEAGSDYAVASDQTVTIQANSVTNQQENLTFENGEAAGNNVVNVYTGQGGNINEWNGGGIETALTKTGLKSGEQVSYSITFSPQYNERAWYCTDFNTSTHSGTWTEITSSPYTMTFTIPNGSNGVTYNLAVKSNWGMNNQGKVTVNRGSRSLSRSASAARTITRYSDVGVTQMSSMGLTRSVTHTNASPASAPDGYAEDSTFEAIEIELNAAGNWKYTFPIQDKFDADGNPYYYYIVETNCSDSDYWIDSYSGDPLNEAGTIKVKNIKEKTGSIQVTKSFSGVEGLPTGFQITNSYNSDVFTVTNASGTGATDDPYVWTLSEIPDGTTVVFTESGATVNGYNLTVTSNGTVVANSQVSATATAGTTVTASLVNTYEPKTTSVTLKKVDKDDVNEDDPELLKGASFTLSKYESDNYQSKDLNWGTQGSVTISDDKKPDGTYTLNGVFTFEGLSVGYYEIEEINFPAGYVKVSSDPTFKIEANASNELTITLLNNPDNLLRLVDGELTIIVGNTPGAALPNTGGIGTGFFTALGAVLNGTAGAVLSLKSVRSRKKQNA